MSKTTMATIEIALLQDETCQADYGFSAAYRCWKGWEIKCCWPPENSDECSLKTYFPANAKVSLETGESMQMYALQVGGHSYSGISSPFLA